MKTLYASFISNQLSKLVSWQSSFVGKPTQHCEESPYTCLVPQKWTRRRPLCEREDWTWEGSTVLWNIRLSCYRAILQSSTMSDSSPNTQNIADYLAQLIKDRKQITAFPSVFLHVERLLDEGELCILLWNCNILRWLFIIKSVVAFAYRLSIVIKYNGIGIAC